MIEINLQNITKIFPSGSEKIYALQDINLIIPKSSFTCIIGQSGSGKSTLLNLIAGLDSPTTGAILFNNKPLKDFTENQMDSFRNQSMGFIFQNFMLLNDFTALENVMMPYYILRGNKKEASMKAMALLESLKLAERANLYPLQLSGGEAQRVAICRAIMNHPKLLLADEPTGNLDEANQQIVMELLFSLKKEYNFTLVMVTHNLELTKNADNLIKLHFGKTLLP